MFGVGSASIACGGMKRLLLFVILVALLAVLARKIKDV